MDFEVHKGMSKSHKSTKNEMYFFRFTSTEPLPPSLPIVPSPLCQLYQFHFGKNDDNEDVQIHSNETIAESEADVAGFCFF